MESHTPSDIEFLQELLEKLTTNATDVEITGGEKGLQLKDVQGLINQGYKQISAKYRLLARLPSGRKALQALLEEDPMAARAFIAQFERMVEGYYLRKCSTDRVELNQEEFQEFKKRNGRVA